VRFFFECTFIVRYHYLQQQSQPTKPRSRDNRETPNVHDNRDRGTTSSHLTTQHVVRNKNGDLSRHRDDSRQKVGEMGIT